MTPARLAMTGVLVGLAYYAGAVVGLALTLRPVPVSTLWPPNAILLAALLLTQARWWPWIMLAVLPAHLLVERAAGIPLPMVLSWYVSNCSEAFLGALIVRRLAGERTRFDGVRPVAAYLLGPVLVAPLVSSFLDAGLVLVNRFGEAPFWTVFRLRLLSNVVAALTIPPFIILVSEQVRRFPAGFTRRRVVEGSLLALLLVLTCLYVFAGQRAGPYGDSGLLYAPLPFLLWAAVRFGPLGASSGLLAFALIAIAGATRGLGPFVSASAQQNALAMQEFILITGISLFALTAILQDRQASAQQTRLGEERLRLALRSAGMGSWEWDLETRQVSWSPEARNILGYTGEVPGLATLLRRVEAADRRAVRTVLQRAAAEDGVLLVEFRFTRPDGNERWIRAHAQSGAEVGPTRVMGILADITVRKQVLDAVMESEARFRSVFELGMLPMCFWHVDGRILDANDAFMRLTGTSRGDIARGEVRWSRLTAPEHQARDLQAIEELAATGRCTPYEKEYVLGDGSRIPVLTGAVQLGADYGICVEMDLTVLKRAERELEQRLEFERLVSDLLTFFATEGAHSATPRLPDWLGRLRSFFGVEQLALIAATRDEVARWPAGVADRELFLVAFPQVSRAVDRGEVFVISSLDQLGPEVAEDRAVLARRGLVAVLAVPVHVGRVASSALMLGHTSPRIWTESDVSRLRWVAGILENLLARSVAEAEAREVESLNAAVLASFSGVTAILDRSGTIVRISGSGTDGPELIPTGGLSLGRNLLESCRQLCERGNQAAARVLESVTATLDGGKVSAVVSYEETDPDGTVRWYEVWITRLDLIEGGAVVRAFDVTGRKTLELEAARHRSDLAHMARVVTMAQLTASFAHELKQPLTAIMANAQAGRRMLLQDQLDRQELEGILSDITRDDLRASDVLNRTSALLKKDAPRFRSLDLNQLVQGVLDLVHSDLLLHGVRPTLSLIPGLPPVNGDDVQLQQVVLNLLLNALDAVRANPAERDVVLATSGRDGLVEVAVSDNGSGIPLEALPHLFDAFYTTKPGGLGMGLSIARSIVESHGGRIQAGNRDGGGAIVSFTLPAGPVSPAVPG